MKIRQTTLLDYEGFVEKFKPRKTTDDCYTPPLVYDTVLRYVDENVMPLEGWNVVRPFYPGGDYERYDYLDNDVVIDNPPFSILAAIVDFYLANDVKFWLFAPSLTLFGYGRKKGVTCVCSHCDVTYENGAVVRTSFLTNMYHEDYAFTMDGVLCRLVDRASEEADKARKPSKQMRKIIYPDSIVTSALLGKVVTRLDDYVWKVPRESCAFVSRLDSSKEIFGGGFLLSERAAAERAAAERVAAERVAAERAVLSDRERAIIASLK